MTPIDEITAAILGTFALISIFLGQLRDLMRQIARTMEEWQNLSKTLHGRPSEGQEAVAPTKETS